MNTPFDVGSQRIILLIFLGIALYACYWLVQPFLQPIIMAILIGLLASPAHERLVHALRGRKTTASLLSCLALSLVFLIPDPGAAGGGAQAGHQLFRHRQGMGDTG